MKEEDRRPDSEQLLRSIQNADGPPGGRLKIFFGYAAGVGKTYAMLEAAHRAKASGTDVVAGYIEPHTRPETMALLEGLEVDPRMVQAGLEILRQAHSTDDRNAALLNALRPFLREERRPRLDRALQLARMTRMIRVAIGVLGGKEGADRV